MRRKSHRSQHDQNSDPLDDLHNETLARNEPIPLVASRPPVRDFQRYEDRRKWDPAGKSPARDALGRTARIVHGKAASRIRRSPDGKPLRSRPSVMRAVWSASPRFEAAHKTIICLKRQLRREVLFAHKRTKKGAGSPKKRNQYSDVRC